MKEQRIHFIKINKMSRNPIDKAISKTSLSYLHQINEQVKEKNVETVYFTLTHYLNTRAKQIENLQLLINEGLIIAHQSEPKRVKVRLTEKGKEAIKTNQYGKVPQKKQSSGYDYTYNQRTNIVE